MKIFVFLKITFKMKEVQQIMETGKHTKNTISKSENMLAEGSFSQLLVKLCIPTVVVILVMIVYNMADTYFIGQTGNPDKIAAISLSMPFFTILSGVATLFGNGGKRRNSGSLN